ncbi:ATP-binding protein [candidate division KSB1 bacterium]|nr:ATP-binding protein [candidate division KSB1 bacterium]
MKRRPFWVQQITQAWKKRPIVWLSGVRRVGKTTLTKMFDQAIYLNCDLPSVVRSLADPESFYDSLDKNATIIFDEVHRVENPAILLKIAADAYPHLKVLATGSSTLAATRKFKDSLTGRKYLIYLPPVLWDECQNIFNVKDLDFRLLHGGLPEPLLSKEMDPSFFSEWIDSFYARDIQELFSIRNRTGFIKLLHLILRQSGGLIEYSNLAKLSNLSLPTVKAHIEAMCVAHATFLLPPFHGGGRREITRRPKCYGFDTGFVSFVKGWDSIREDDRGLLWEHLVLDKLRTHISNSNLYYWQDKSHREIDFIVKEQGQRIHTIECKINPDQFNPDTHSAFRSFYPHGDNYLISPGIKMPYKRKFKDVVLNYFSINNCPLFQKISTLGN